MLVDVAIGRGFGRRIANTATAEATKLMASAMMANGALTMPMSTPPNPGPAIWAADRLISSFALPSTIWSRSTSDGR